MQTGSNKLKIDGIKVSNELAAIKLQATEEHINTESKLCGVLAREKINMPYVSVARKGNSVTIICCIEKGAERHAEKALGPVFKRDDYSIEFIPKVGLISIFPHQSSFEVFADALSIFAGSGIPLYGVASSLSTLSFLTDFEALERLVGLMSEQFTLPPDHVPLRTEIQVKQVAISQTDGDKE